MHRCVLYLGGYDPVTPEKFFRRQAREIGHYRDTWGVETSVSPPEKAADGHVWRTEITSKGDDWSSRTDFRLLAWDDLVKGDFARPIWQRVPLSLGVLADFLVSGTVFRYFFAAWRFALYFIAPFIFSLAFLLVAAFVAAEILHWQHWSAPLLAIVAGLAIYAGLMRFPGDRWFVSHLLDARTFMGEYMRGCRADMTARVDRFADEIVEAAQSGRFDEILIVGHSQGSVFALEALERALARDSDLARRGAPVAIMTVGSCVLQLGLHPAAKQLRARIARVQAEASIEWIEFQALTDVVNFYKTDPARLMRLAKPGSRPFPHVSMVRIREMLAPDDYSRIRNSLFRVHYQFVMGNTRRYFYDFFSICCGPLRLGDRFSLTPSANTNDKRPGFPARDLPET
ncbi:lipase [Kaistia sp. 32K]|uniref:lipase n=1 Tax=Kaistia sp. 32K TaxID=2795690 RepID=UPI001AEEF3E2|nr:lipase [Kaistia sp. 32K]